MRFCRLQEKFGANNKYVYKEGGVAYGNAAFFSRYTSSYTSNFLNFDVSAKHIRIGIGGFA